MATVKKCPIEVAFYRTSIGKKWTLTIIRDLLFGSTRFSEFLSTNPQLSSKVLNDRLKELISDGIIKKQEQGQDTSYNLTPKGMELNSILYHLSIFGSKYYPKEVFGESNINHEEMVEIFGRGFKIDKEFLTYEKLPKVEKEKLTSQAGRD